MIGGSLALACAMASPGAVAALPVSPVTVVSGLADAAAVKTAFPLQAPGPALKATPAPTATAPVLHTVIMAAPDAISVARAPAQMQPLADQVTAHVDRGNQDPELTCLASAVYFEARGEPLDGQLAVAEVVLNRARSGIYPNSVCDVITQRAQFSFVRRGRIPPVDPTNELWRRAIAIADIARQHTALAPIASNVLWYHASYVAPSWRRQHTRVAEIGTQIFYS